MTIFSSIFGTPAQLSIRAVLICSLVSLAIGVVFGVIYRFTTRNYSKSMIFSLILLPVAVQTVIMVVNGNLGVGISVAGAFALVRFRSAPASAKEITLMFCAMALGIASGAGYVYFAGIMFVIIAAVYLVLSFVPLCKEDVKTKRLKVTVPENFDYTTEFDDIFAEYTKKHELKKVKTTGLGTMYELTYDIVVDDVISEKKLIDEIRLRNGNLSVICTFQETDKELF